VVIKAIVVIMSAACTGLYALLQCDEDSKHGHKTYDDYFEVFHAPLANDGESSPPTSRNFQDAIA
jgi:hypothetical protein